MSQTHHRAGPRRLLTAAALALAVAACSSSGATDVGADDSAAVTAGDAADEVTGDEVTGDEVPATTQDTPDAPGTEEATPEEATTEDTSDATDPVLGTVIVAGTTYEITELRNCEPLDLGDGMERLLELQGLGRDGGERVQIDVYVSDGPAGGLHEVSWNGPEGVRGNQALELGGDWLDNAQTALGSPPVALTDERVSGALPVLDAMTQDDPVDLAFDLPVPAERISCR